MVRTLLMVRLGSRSANSLVNTGSSAPGDALVVSMSPLIKWERNSTRCSMSSFGYGVAGHVDQLAPIIGERVVECQSRSPPSGQAVQPIFELAIERVQFRQGIGGGRSEERRVGKAGR